MDILQEFLTQLERHPETVQFEQLMQLIDRLYDYTPTAFSNGEGLNRICNRAGENEGSCKLFAFASLHGFDEMQTLHCFGEYYRRDVLQHPEADDHANIRQFMKTGWQGISFEQPALQRKKH